MPHARQPNLPAHIPRHAGRLPRHIDDPPRARLDLVPRRQLLRQKHPTQGIPHGADLIANMALGPGTHILARLVVGEQMGEVLCDARVVGRRDEEPGALVRNLQRNAAALRGDDGRARVQGLGDFDFEALARGELQRHGRVGHERVEDLVRRADAREDYVPGEVAVQRFDGAEGRVEDGGCVWVVDGA
jgi:hypothetical protein